MPKIIIRHSIPRVTQNNLAELPTLLQRIYQARGIYSVIDLENTLSHLLPYQQLLHIETAVDCLVQALQQQKSIMIIGDFDADGATSTALAVTALSQFGAQKVSYLVPNRFTFGYGLTPEIVQVAAVQKPDVIITVDNGISSIAGVATAKALGIQVIITDHHLPGNELPAADAMVNPNQPGDAFPSKNLAGVGVIFYVMLALRQRLRQINWFAAKKIAEPNMAYLLDLVALGTVADVVPLDKNNRILVRYGLARIITGKARIGIQALLEIAGRSPHQLTANSLAYAIAPRLNAAGRLDDMSLGIACLLAEDVQTAKAIAIQLDALNRERQVIEEEMQQQAQHFLNELQWRENLPIGLCLFKEDWHQGVIGLLASRVKEQLHRPVIAFAPAHGEELKGSARSVSGVHIRDVLASIAAHQPHLMTKFGGHAMAAGLSLPRQHYTPFCQAFDAEVRKHLNVEQLQGKIFSDGELIATELTLATAELIRKAGPWGQGFPEPIFDGVFRIIEQRIVGEHHLKLTLQTLEENSKILNAIAFNVDLKQWPNHRSQKIHAAYRLDINEFNHCQNLQLIIEHLISC